MAIVDILFETREADRMVARGSRTNHLNQVADAVRIASQVVLVSPKTFSYVAGAATVLFGIPGGLDVDVLYSRL
jgi:hypothetical protein